MTDRLIDNQVLFASQLRTIAPNAILTMTVTAPACAYQIDLFYGNLITSFANNVRYGERRLAGEARIRNNNFCAPAISRIEIVKSAPATVPRYGDIEFTFTIKNTGTAPENHVYFSDVIQNGLTLKSISPSSSCNVISGRVNDIECNFASIAASSTKIIKAVFSTGYISSGDTMFACEDKIINRAVIRGNSFTDIYSNTTQTTVKCPVPYTFTVSCAAPASSVIVGNPVLWTSTNTASATATKTFVWSGTDALTGNNATTSKIYTATGTKTATISVTSLGVTKQASCSVNIVPAVVIPPYNFTLACSAQSTQANKNTSVVWTSTNNATGTKTFVWSGTDALTGNNATTSKIYTATGTKNASIAITSQGVTKQAMCSINIVEPAVVTTPDIILSCAANPTSAVAPATILWIATATGGNNSYVYSWSGTDGLTGSAATTSLNYTSTGTKNAVIMVTSGNKTATSTCATNLTQQTTTGGGGGGGSSVATLDAVCAVTPTNPRINEAVTFNVNLSTTDAATYSWTGADGIATTSKSFIKSFATTGSKNATVVVTSGARSTTRTCSVVVGDTNVSVTTSSVPNQVAGVYLSQVPYTGLKENAFAALGLMILMGVAGYIAFVYTKKHNTYAYAVVAFSAAKKVSQIEKVNLENKFVSDIEAYARSQSASLSDDAVTAIVATAKGNIVWAKGVVDQAVGAHGRVDWTLVSLDSIRKIYPYI